jgi:DNA-binding CsgD family transcriptional regulator
VVSTQQFSELIGSIYDTGLDFTRWPATLDRLADAFGGSATALGRQDAVTQSGDVILARSEPVFTRRYSEYYASRNIIYQHARNLPAGTILTERMVMPKEQFLKSEFYNDFLRPQDVHSSLTIYLLRDRRWSIRIGIGLPRKHDEWTKAQLDFCRMLAPHLQRAVQINLKLGETCVRESGAADALDRLPVGVFLVDSEARPLLVNRMGEQMIADADGLQIDSVGLQAATAEQTKALRTLIAAAAGMPDHCSSGGAISLRRPSARRNLTVLIAPIKCELPWLPGPRPAAAVFVSDPEREPFVPAHHLQQMYGLTPAEAAVAVALARGEGVQSVADELRIALPTVRTHLQHVFEKTDTRRQAELVRLLLGIQAGVHD